MKTLKELVRKAAKSVPLRGNGQEQQRQEAVKNHGKTSEELLQLLRGSNGKKNRKDLCAL